MSGMDKMKNAAEKAMGTAKEKVGEATGDEQTQAEGVTDQKSADLKQTGEKLKDTFK